MRSALLLALFAVGAIGLATAPDAAASVTQSTISCPAATGGGVGATATGGSCATVTGAAADGTTQLQGDVTYTTCVTSTCPTVTLTVTAKGATVPVQSGSVTESPDVLPGSGTIPVTLPATAPDGTYTAALSGDGATATATFRLAVPPSPVTFGATDTAKAGRATVTWSVSAPTPATAYALDVDGRPTTVVPACSGGRCTGTVSGLAGGHVFQVLASRPGGEGAAALTTTAITTATVRAAPAGTSTASHGSTGTVVGATSGSPGPPGSTGSTGGGSRVAPQGATGTDPAAGSGRATIGVPPRRGVIALPALPALPQLSQTAANGDGEPTDPGTYAGTLPYAGDLTVRDKVPHATALARVENVTDDRVLLEATAAALLLALAAAHLRVLARRTTADL